MGASRRRARRRASGAVALAAVSLAWVAVPPADAEGECRITGGYASVLLRESPTDPTPVFEGAMFAITRDCGDGPLSVKGTFAPVGGTPASCFPQPSTFETAYTNQNRASCAFTGSVGLGLSGTPVTVTATAEVAGAVHGAETIRDADEARVEPRTAEAAGTCVLPLPEPNGRATCSLF